MNCVEEEKQKVELVADLSDYFKVRVVSIDEMYLKPRQVSYCPDDILFIVELIGQSRPDECSIEGMELRLWWD